VTNFTTGSPDPAPDVTLFIELLDWPSETVLATGSIACCQREPVGDTALEQRTFDVFWSPVEVTPWQKYALRFSMPEDVKSAGARSRIRRSSLLARRCNPI
jgi:hypothetical protein